MIIVSLVIETVILLHSLSIIWALIISLFNINLDDENFDYCELEIINHVMTYELV